MPCPSPGRRWTWHTDKEDYFKEKNKPVNIKKNNLKGKLQVTVSSIYIKRRYGLFGYTSDL